jgi:hypothetical protein
VQLRSGLKAQVHPVMAKEGVLPTVVDMFGHAGQVQLNEMGLGCNYTIRVESLRDLIEVYDREVAMLERDTTATSVATPATRRCRRSTGRPHHRRRVGGRDRGRHPLPDATSSVLGAELTPGRRESDVKGHDEGITKKGSKLLRWALIEGISRYHGGAHLAVEFHRLAERRGKNRARVAIARRVLTHAYYGLRDGEIRCLNQPAEAA